MKEQFQGASEIAYNKLTAREPHTPVNNPPAFVSQFPALENNLAPPQELIIQRTRQESRSKNTFPEDIRLFALRASRGGERCQRPECSVLRQISRTADRVFAPCSRATFVLLRAYRSSALSLRGEDIEGRGKEKEEPGVMERQSWLSSRTRH